MEGKYAGKLDPGVGDVVAVSDKNHLDAVVPQPSFVKGKGIGQYLTGMRKVGQGVDNRNRGVCRKSFNDAVLVQTGDNGVVIAGKQTCDILNGLSRSHPYRFAFETDCVTTEFMNAKFKGNPRAQ